MGNGKWKIAKRGAWYWYGSNFINVANFQRVERSGVTGKCPRGMEKKEDVGLVVAINVLLTRAIKYEIFKSWHGSLAFSWYSPLHQAGKAGEENYRGVWKAGS